MIGLQSLPQTVEVIRVIHARLLFWVGGEYPYEPRDVPRQAEQGGAVGGGEETHWVCSRAAPRSERIAPARITAARYLPGIRTGAVPISSDRRLKIIKPSNRAPHAGALDQRV